MLETDTSKQETIEQLLLIYAEKKEHDKNQERRNVDLLWMLIVLQADELITCRGYYMYGDIA